MTCLAFRAKGGLLLTLRKQFAFFDPDSSKLEILATIEADKPNNRFNDGRVDPQGRFWAGTMGDPHWDQPVGSLYRFDSDQKVTRMWTDVICSNGTAWSPDGRTMYYTESFRYAIFAYDFDSVAGSLANRRLFAEVDRKMRIAQEEIFGPVVSILPCEDLEDAIEIANGIEYGLSSAHFQMVCASMRRGLSGAIRSALAGSFATIPEGASNVRFSFLCPGP